MELVTEGVNIPVAEKHFFAFNNLDRGSNISSN